MMMPQNDIRKKYESESVNDGKIIKNVDDTAANLWHHLQTSLNELHKEKAIEIEAIPQVLSERFNAVCTHFLPYFGKADFLALKYQAYYKWGSILIYLLSAISVIAVSAQALFNSLPHHVMLIEILAISSIIFIIKYGNSIGWHRRWLDYRLLAERFRFAVFMALVGEKVSTKFSGSDMYNTKEKGHWVFSCFSEAWDNREKKDIAMLDDPNVFMILKRFISLAWLEDQKKYHLKNIEKHMNKHKKYSVTGEALFFMTLIAAVLHYLGAGGHERGPLLAFLAISFPAAGAAFSALRSHFEHNRLSRRSEKIVYYIEELEDRLGKADSMEGLLLVVREAESLMLNENSEWYVMIGFKGLETPA
jgi:hypothetical protein